jgi:hypothetical protein
MVAGTSVAQGSAIWRLHGVEPPSSKWSYAPAPSAGRRTALPLRTGGKRMSAETRLEGTVARAARCLPVRVGRHRAGLNARRRRSEHGFCCLMPKWRFAPCCRADFSGFLTFMVQTELRLQECRSIDPARDIKNGCVHVVGKFGKSRAVPLTRVAPKTIDDQLADQLAADERLWPQNPQRLREVLATAAKRVGARGWRHRHAQQITRSFQR